MKNILVSTKEFKQVISLDAHTILFSAKVKIKEDLWTAQLINVRKSIAVCTCSKQTLYNIMEANSLTNIILSSGQHHYHRHKQVHNTITIASCMHYSCY